MAVFDDLGEPLSTDRTAVFFHRWQNRCPRCNTGHADYTEQLDRSTTPNRNNCRCSRCDLAWREPVETLRDSFGVILRHLPTSDDAEFDHWQNRCPRCESNEVIRAWHRTPVTNKPLLPALQGCKCCNCELNWIEPRDPEAASTPVPPPQPKEPGMVKTTGRQWITRPHAGGKKWCKLITGIHQLNLLEHGGHALEGSFVSIDRPVILDNLHFLVVADQNNAGETAATTTTQLAPASAGVDFATLGGVRNRYDYILIRCDGTALHVVSESEIQMAVNAALARHDVIPVNCRRSAMSTWSNMAAIYMTMAYKSLIRLAPVEVPIAGPKPRRRKIIMGLFDNAPAAEAPRPAATPPAAPGGVLGPDGKPLELADVEEDDFTST